MNNKTSVDFYLFKEIILKYKPYLNEKEVLNIYYSNGCKNINDILKYIVQKNNSILKKIYVSDDYKKLLLIYKKTRIFEFPPLDVFNALTMEMSKKFKLKIYRIFRDSHLFSDSKSLVNMIGMFGLFEDDMYARKRVNEIIKIFFYQNAFSKRKEMANCYTYKGSHVTYLLSDVIKETILEDLKPYLFLEITPEYYSFLRHMRGNFGRKINDFLNPYVLENKCYYLKDGIKNCVKFLFPDDYKKLDKIYLNDYDSLKSNKIFSGLINPYKCEIEDGYILRKDLSLSERKKILSCFKEYELTYGPSDIQSMFRNAIPNYCEDFYNFFVSHQSDISVSSNNFSKLSDVQKNFKDVMKYYLSRGNSNPDFITMIEWLRNIPYDVKFGDEEFALEAKNAGVLKSGYEYYSNLLKTVRMRNTRAIPNHDKNYRFIDNDGNVYEVKTKILKGTDPLNLLIGESKYTDCCQKYNDLGQMCMEHAALSTNGGIFIVGIVEKGYIKILSQSWIWVNEQELVLDNVEQTSILSSSSNSQRKIYEDIIAFAIKCAAKDIIVEADEGLKLFIHNKKKEIENISNTKVKERKFQRLKDIQKRQSLKVITVGTNYSDIIVSDYFEKKAKRPLFLPKDYNTKGYTDAHNRYIAAGSEENILTPSKNYVEANIYRDIREIVTQKLSDISNQILIRIMNIEKFNYKNLKEENNFKNEFCKKYCLDVNDSMITYGEDWYSVYTINGINRHIIRCSVGTPRLFDEREEQKFEVSEFLSNKIVKKCNRVEVKL